MGLASKREVVVPAVKGSVNLSRTELQFIMKKLRDADYKGHEFEAFYNVYSKIQDSLEQFDK